MADKVVWYVRHRGPYGQPLTMPATVPCFHTCHTFEEAIRAAHEVARTSVGKVKVRRFEDRWALLYRYKPVPINGAA